MLYAKVVLGLPVEGSFDYIVPEDLIQKICVGQRVVVSFGRQKKIAYIVKVSRRTSIKNLKTILKLLDEIPVLDKNMLLLTQKISEYYCCSWGDAIEASLPMGLRQGKAVKIDSSPGPGGPSRSVPKPILVESLEIKQRWDKVYLPKIKETINNKQAVIVLLPDAAFLPKIQAIIESNLSCRLTILARNQPDELNKWGLIKEGKTDIVVGMRSAVFSPFNNLGLLIVDEENTAFGYKQDQSPHYDARQIALIRSRIDKTGIIFGGRTLSLESIFLVKKNKAEYISIPSNKNLPEVKIIDTKGVPLISRKRNIVLSHYLQSSILETLNTKGKILLFYNRLGFATIASCLSCAAVLKCQRCNVNLVFHYKENKLRCHRCNFKITAPKLCPNCNSDYIRYRGIGTEKIESEFSRLFPQARIAEFDPGCLNSDADIFISTQAVIKEADLSFSLIVGLSIDNMLNHIDFRASEKTFALLDSLMNLTDQKIIIQTNLPKHYIFKALTNKNTTLFYDEELKTRRPLKLPPYKHLAIVQLRGKKEEKVKAAAGRLFEFLSKGSAKKIEIVSMNPGSPSKLRGNFYWQILLKSASGFEISRSLKMSLKNFSHSGIIITVDVDPI